MRTAPLTAGELAPIPDFIDKWTRIGLSTVPVDHVKAEPALCQLYAAAGLAEPAVVWAPCPMTAMLSAIVYSAIRATGREADARDRQALAAIVERMIRFALIATIPGEMHRRMRSGVEMTVQSALRLGLGNGSGFDAVFAIYDWRGARLDHVPDKTLAPALRKRLRALLFEPVCTGVRSLRALVEPPLRAIERGVLGVRTGLAGGAYSGAPLWAPYAAERDYLNQVLGIRLGRYKRFGTLGHLDPTEPARMLMVEVVNRTPEPDGAYRPFLLRVDPELRPILADGSFGPPQKATARNAVAASFGLSGAEYMPEVET